jgi:hypothetical protein
MALWEVCQSSEATSRGDHYFFATLEGRYDVFHGDISTVVASNLSHFFFHSLNQKRNTSLPKRNTSSHLHIDGPLFGFHNQLAPRLLHLQPSKVADHPNQQRKYRLTTCCWFLNSSGLILPQSSLSYSPRYLHTAFFVVASLENRVQGGFSRIS